MLLASVGALALLVSGTEPWVVTELQPYSTLTLTREMRCPSLFQAGSLEQRISGCAAVRDAIVWEDAGGGLWPYASWSSYSRQQLQGLYDALLRGDEKLEVRCPSLLGMEAYVDGVYATGAEAFSIYLAHVAHVLFVEIGRVTTWSVLEATARERQLLFDSRWYFSRIVPGMRPLSAYPPHIRPGRDFQPIVSRQGGLGTPCDPRHPYAFVRGRTSGLRRDMLRDTQARTLAVLSRWFRQNMRHASSYISSGEGVYDGLLWSTYLPDRLRAQAPPPTTEFDSSWRAVARRGCHSVGASLVDLARSVNLPLLSVEWDQVSSPTSIRPHSATLWGWGKGDPRVLVHNDLLIDAAEDLHRALPLDPFFGTPLGESAADELWLDLVWPRASELEDWGFVYLSDLPPKSGISSDASAGPTIDRPDAPKVVGYWLDTYRTGPEEWFGAGRIWEGFVAHQLCDAKLVASYCAGSRSAYDALLADRGYLPPAPGLYPHTYSPTTSWARAGQCAAAWGGCSATRDRLTSWDARQGLDTWRW